MCSNNAQISQGVFCWHCNMSNRCFTSPSSGSGPTCQSSVYPSLQTLSWQQIFLAHACPWLANQQTHCLAKIAKKLHNLSDALMLERSLHTSIGGSVDLCTPLKSCLSRPLHFLVALYLSYAMQHVFLLWSFLNGITGWLEKQKEFGKTLTDRTNKSSLQLIKMSKLGFSKSSAPSKLKTRTNKGEVKQFTPSLAACNLSTLPKQVATLSRHGVANFHFQILYSGCVSEL